MTSAVSSNSRAENKPHGRISYLKEKGFARLPGRGDDERLPGPRTTVAPVADVRALGLDPRRLRTKFGAILGVKFYHFRIVAHDISIGYVAGG